MDLSGQNQAPGSFISEEERMVALNRLLCTYARAECFGNIILPPPTGKEPRIAQHTFFSLYPVIGLIEYRRKRLAVHVTRRMNNYGV
jgi:hypothetical protein